MKATGDWVELAGTLITMYGLWFAAEAESTAQQALSELRASTRLDAATDLSIALFGIATTAVGIVLGMVAVGRFSWLPW
ncbi:hypothetical protein [Nocardia veterana]|uniref:Uncharacterized protein n=1 Tax=Nocardia veterana TaxID=132249 RepID=A0A7X6M270_9NOCA|nr:hypothetical protein [Nocardia veterana]NKY88929.1 hypothetical protein [Nocardia veterana]